MENIYEQLYRIFVETQSLTVRTEQDEIIEDLAAVLSLTPEKRIILIDLITHIRIHWGLESFATGLRLGLELAVPYDPPSEYRILREFLSKLNQPVA